MFQQITRIHGVTPQQMARALKDRPNSSEFAILLAAFAVLFGVAAWLAGKFLWRNYPPVTEASAGRIMALFGGIGGGALGVLLLDQSWVFRESRSLKHRTLSYRTERNPWGHHWQARFLCGSLFFWGVVAVLRPRAVKP